MFSRGQMIDRIRSAHARAVLVVSDGARASVRAVLGEKQPGLPILGHGELAPGLSTRVVGLVLDPVG